MYEGVKNTMKRNMYVRLLTLIVAETVKGADTFAMVDEKKANELNAAQAGFILTNPATKNDKGEIAVRATPEAVAAVQALAPASDAAAKDEPKQEFKIESDVPVPSTTRAARTGAETYPFSKLEVNQSFFIAATASRPEPAKSLASTVSAASRRYAVRQLDEATKKEKIVSYDRKFLIRPVEGGARVWRTK